MSPEEMAAPAKAKSSADHDGAAPCRAASSSGRKCGHYPEGHFITPGWLVACQVCGTTCGEVA